ncbi:unnamed protein product [Spirodela intermedia]|uniref:Uncharacterized protein n=1 Tax=Spirodela intermedia TaxID=51605 RepID=A0A7I8JJ29_SPIIN|nr:unnamed protein product [Spirodela intermedia]CAA6670166.1 unnamed protein product [Spirodela intermedia]
MEQYVDLDKISLNEVIGSLSVHELRLKERESQEEEYALLARALSKGQSRVRMVEVNIPLLMKVKSTLINLKYNVITVRNMTILLTNVEVALLAEVHQTDCRLYLLKLNVIEQYLITKEDEITS